jgi:hypothetical protein
MSIVAPIPDIEVQSSRVVVTSPTWFEVRQQDLPLWNDVLRGTEGSIYQYPFWNEPYRPLWLTPRYLAWGTQDRPLAFVAILTLGVGPVKIGLVFRGPVCLRRGHRLSREIIADLLTWARSQGYVFIRFTHSDPQVLHQLAAAGHAEEFDGLPYFLDYPVLSPDYIVEQFETEEETQAGFDREARRKLRRAMESGYEFTASDSPAALLEHWELYRECAERKHFRLERPLSVYQETVRLAQAHDCVRIYSVRMNGKTVGSALVFRDHTTAHCLLAAFDAEHHHAAVFLHWHAMRDMYRQGAHRYNLGPGPGSLARFKRQFCPSPVRYPGALTLVLKQSWFRCWKKVYPVAKGMRPTLRRVVSCIPR